MTSLFSFDRLEQCLEQQAGDYASRPPFPHLVIDQVADEALLSEAVQAFPAPGELDFYQYDNPLEKKLAFDQIALLPAPITRVLHAMSEPRFLRFLERLSGIDGLIPDPYFRGGGIHQIERGGKLDVHIDFNHYQKLKLDRRLNVILYLNQDWQEAYGGHLELWSGHRDEQAQPILDECVERVLPVFNRMVVFSTSEHSYHGHPEPLTCPEGRTRKSVAAYYYTNGYADQAEVKPHSTTFVRRPGDPEEPMLEQLRAKRNQGRLATNVKSDHVANK